MIRVYDWEKTDLTPLDLRLLKARAEQGGLEAAVAIADFYARGRYGFAHDIKLAKKYLDIAMGKRYPQSFYVYGQWLLEPDVIGEVDYYKSLKFFERSADLGFGRGMAKVGQAFLYGFGVDVNYNLAEQWLLKARCLEAVDALKQLAQIYDDLGRTADCKRLIETAETFVTNP